MIPTKFSTIYHKPLGSIGAFAKTYIVNSARNYFKLQIYAADTADCVKLKSQIDELEKDIASIKKRSLFYDEGKPYGLETRTAYLSLCVNAYNSKTEKYQQLSCATPVVGAGLTSQVTLPAGIVPPNISNIVDNLVNNPAVQTPTNNLGTNSNGTATNTSSTPLTLNNIATPSGTSNAANSASSTANTGNATLDTPSTTSPTETVKESFKSNKTLWFAGIAAFVLIGGVIIYKNRK